MSRELKFRAWDKKGTFVSDQETGAAKPHMIPDVGVSVSVNYALWSNREKIWFNHSGRLHVPPDHPDFVLMQFTGLRDVEGQDIYEGDIILQNGPGSATGVIEFRHGNCLRANHHNTILLSFIYMTAKVIGNIYENPELDPR